MKPYPKKFSHIGLSVKDIEAFVKWYQDVLGFYVLMEPTLVKNENQTAIGKMCVNVFGANFKDFKIAHMSTADGIRIEVFEFPETLDDTFEFNPYKKGIFHLAIQDPNIEQLAKKMVEAGGKTTYAYYGVLSGWKTL